MNGLVSYISLIAIMLVVGLLIWSLILSYQDKKARKLSAGKRLAQLRKRIESLPEATDEDRSKKDALFRELSFEYFENILSGIDYVKINLHKKEKPAGKPEKKPNKPQKTKKK